MERYGRWNPTWARLGIMGTVTTLILSCGFAKSITGGGGDDNNNSSSGENYEVTGSLNLTEGTALTGLNLTDYTLKATYAALNEDSGTLSSDGSYKLSIKNAPFSLTVFSGAAPVCTFIFNVADSNVGSIEPSSNMDFGAITCEDGQAVVPADRLEGKIKSDFLDRIRSGDIDSDLKAKLLDEEGLSIRMIAGGGGGDRERREGGRLTCPDCGDQGGGFETVDPKLCTSVGYSVPDFFFRNDDRYRSEEDHNEGPTLFITEAEDGTYNMIARSESQYGGEEDEIFPNIKLGGVGEEFALVGTSTLPENQIKSEVAAEVLREALYSMNSGDVPPPPPSFTDHGCDPLNIANNIVGQLGYSSFNTNSVFGDNFRQPPPSHQSSQSAAPKCSTLSGSAAGKTTIQDFCFAADGETLKSQSTLAGKSICQAAKNGIAVNYHNFHPVDDSGNKILKCAREWNDHHGWHHEVVEGVGDEGSCYARDSGDPNVWHKWGPVSREMFRDCSELRLAGVDLKICQWSHDAGIEPNYRRPDHNEAPEPDNWFDNRHLILEADSVADEAKASGGSGFSQMKNVIDNINRCAANFDSGASELQRRKARINATLAAIELIKSEQNDDGSKKYIKDQVEKFREGGDFTFTSDEIGKLEQILEKAVTALDGWADSIATVKKTYNLMRKAAVKAADSSSGRCIPDELATTAAFEAMYSDFDAAYNGIEGNSENRGLTKWQDAAFRHFQCMSMDENIRRINEFGISAPVQGIKDSNSRSTSSQGGSSSDDLFLVNGGCQDGKIMDHRGQCIEMVSCKIPAGATTYIPFGGLIDLASIQDGCQDVKQKVAFMGGKAKHNHERNGVQIQEGDLVSKVLLMTRLPQSSCKVTVQFPALDNNGCFKYTNSEGKNWGDLTDEERRSATASDYTMSFESQEVPMSQMASREIMELILIPNSGIENASERNSSGGNDDDFGDFQFE
ncbi:MAG: hypothetical protein OXT67_11795 [Zetaproteobacteria bacterium]|nr:hypothetical protein [Zetaproteobacteria bacterium]